MDYLRLRPKYVVTRIADAGEELGPTMKSTDPDSVDSPFVLLPRKDPAAFEALRGYASLCEPRLGNEIRAWLRKIAAAEPVYGTQGARNRTAFRLKMLAEAD